MIRWTCLSENKFSKTLFKMGFCTAKFSPAVVNFIIVLIYVIISVGGYVYTKINCIEEVALLSLIQ